MSIPILIYDYETNEPKTWFVPDYIYRQITSSKFQNFVPIKESVVINIEVKSDPKGFKIYDVKINLNKKQRLRKLFFKFFYDAYKKFFYDAYNSTFN